MKIRHLSPLGHGFAHQFPSFEGQRRLLKAALAAMRAYERVVFARLMDGMKAILGVIIYGITDQARLDQRVPTIAFRLDGYSPREVAEQLGRAGIFVWDGNYYALAVTERLGVEESGGMVRLGIAHDNTVEEVERLLTVVNALAHQTIL